MRESTGVACANSTFLSALSSSDMRTTGTSVCSSLDSSSRVQYLQSPKDQPCHDQDGAGRLIACRYAWDLTGPVPQVLRVQYLWNRTAPCQPQADSRKGLTY